MKQLILLSSITFLINVDIYSQSLGLWGVTSGGGDYAGGTIFNTDLDGNNQSTEHTFIVNHIRSVPYEFTFVETDNGTLFGASAGGVNELGVLFEYDIVNDRYVTKVQLEQSNGMIPTGRLLKASNGNIYGLTTFGGSANNGVLYEYNPSLETYTVKYNFVGFGRFPWGGLIEGSNGKFYGMTRYGGVSDKGVIFEYDPVTNVYAKKFDFSGTSGSHPFGSLFQASNGKIYGMTSEGGTNNLGVIFEYDPSTNVYTKKIDFNGTNGSMPYGSLIEAPNNKLYGMTRDGGTHSLGVLFEYDPNANIFTKILDFNGTNGGATYSSLTLATNGNLYGTTPAGGSSNSGVLFEYNPLTNTFIKKMDYSDPDDNGGYLGGVLMQANNGNLYGMTNTPFFKGVMYEYNLIDDNYSIMFKHNTSDDGVGSVGVLAKAFNDKLYGMTYFGGIHDLGIIFEYNPATNTYSKKHDFNGANGMYPIGGLIESSNGKLYGMTSLGGIHNSGVIFEYDPATNTFLKKIDIDPSQGGGYSPYGELIEASNGKFYGVATNSLFEFDPITNMYTVKVALNDFTNGFLSYGSLVEASNGNIYGLTYDGGANNFGVLFEYDISTNTFLQKIDFDGTSNGSHPRGSLIDASNGKLYGMTSEGGLNNLGVVFEYDPIENTYIKKLDFDGSNGSNPYGSFIEASNGKLYGMTREGGLNSLGVIFEYDIISDIYIKKLDFNGPAYYNFQSGTSYNGASPVSSLFELCITPKPIGQVNQLFCGQASISDLIVTGTNLKWYDAAKKGNLLNETDLLTTGTYYVTQTNGCESTSRLAISVTVINDAPTGENIQSFCDLATVSDLNAVGSDIQWYDSPVGGNLYASSTTLTDGFTYHASQTINGCESEERLSVLAGIYTTPSVDAPSNVTVCDSYTLPSLSVGNYYTGSGGSGTMLSAGADITSTQTVYVYAANGSCFDENSFTVAINNTPNVFITTAGTTLNADVSASGATFQWLDCDNGNALISGANQNTYSPLISGNYAVQVSLNNCAITSDCYNIEVTSVGLDEYEVYNLNFQLYPNPFDDMVTFEGENIYSLKVFDVAGKLVYSSTNFTQKRMVLDFSHFEAGTYVVFINEEKYLKLVK
jgi:uncharacterized repeat protein (TIGR03803 family)